MGNSTLMTMIKTFHKLMEIKSGQWLVKAAWESNEIKELTTISKFKSDIRNYFLLSTSFRVCLLTIFQLLHHICMWLKSTHCLHFIHYQLLHLCIHVIVHYFNCNLLSGLLIVSELDFAACSRPKCSFDIEFTELSWHVYLSKS